MQFDLSFFFFFFFNLIAVAVVSVSILDSRISSCVAIRHVLGSSF